MAIRQLGPLEWCFADYPDHIWTGRIKRLKTKRRWKCQCNHDKIIADVQQRNYAVMLRVVKAERRELKSAGYTAAYRICDAMTMRGKYQLAFKQYGMPTIVCTMRVDAIDWSSLDIRGVTYARLLSKLPCAIGAFIAAKNEVSRLRKETARQRRQIAELRLRPGPDYLAARAHFSHLKSVGLSQ
jgi:hypothetical protein